MFLSDKFKYLLCLKYLISCLKILIPTDILLKFSLSLYLLYYRDKRKQLSTQLQHQLLFLVHLVRITAGTAENLQVKESNYQKYLYMSIFPKFEHSSLSILIRKEYENNRKCNRKKYSRHFCEI